MNTGNRYIRLLAFLATMAISLLFCGPALAVDDGPRAYWKGRAGTHGFSFQYLRLDLQADDSQQFAPGQYIYPNSDVEANLIIANYLYHLTLFNRPSSISFGIAGGSVDLKSNGYADPILQLDVNLFGTPPLKANFDLIDYEPTWTLDTAIMLGLPIGQYDANKLVNLGQNRWFGRIALPFKYHFGVFSRGYMKSLEVTPSVWLFAENDDFMGQKLENEVMWQLVFWDRNWRTSPCGNSKHI
jgi:hypothetical protein